MKLEDERVGDRADGRLPLPAPIATGPEWAEEFLRWTATLPRLDAPLPEEALSRENFYEDGA